MFRILWAYSREGDSLTAALPLKQALIASSYEVQEVSLVLDFLQDVGLLLQTIRSIKPDLVLLEPPGFPLEKLSHSIKIGSAIKANEETEALPLFFVFNARAEGLDFGLDPRLQAAFDNGANDVLLLKEPNPELSFEHDKPYEEALLRIKAAIQNGRSSHQAIVLAQQLSKMNTELYERNLQVEKELYTTRQLQQSLLPAFLPDPDAEGSEAAMRISKRHYHDDRLRISGLYLPCDALGGDFYDVIRFADATVGVSLADVSGHGVPAAFITAIYKSAFYRITHNHSAANDILFHLNNELAEIVKTGDYVTALYLCMTMGEQAVNVEYSGAGHPYPLYYNAKTKTLQRLTENATPLVWVKDMAYPLGRLNLEPEDKLLLFTDGVTEMRNTEGAFYGDEALEAAFLELLESKKPYVLDELLGLLSDFAAGQALEDDISMVLIEAL